MVKIVTKPNVKQVEKRPWGSFEVLHETNVGDALGYKVKRLDIYAGEKTSLQIHQHRAEHWVVESGVAKVTVGTEVKYLQAGESVDIPKNTTHRIENEGSSVLQVIEVQTGELLLESDILRIEDKYERN